MHVMTYMRPDLAYVVSMVNSFMLNPRKINIGEGSSGSSIICVICLLCVKFWKSNNRVLGCVASDHGKDFG